MAWVWLSSGFMLPLGMRLHSKRLPPGSNIIRYEFTDLTNCRKSTEQHGCYESRSIKLNYSDSPAHYTTVLHKYNSPAVFLREDTEEGASEVTSKHCRRFPVLATFCFMIGQAASESR